MKQFLSFFRTNAKALKHRQKILQDSIREYERLLQDTVGRSTELYQCRQMAYDRLASLQYYVQNLPKSPEMLIKGIDRALDFASVMKEARDNELDNLKDNIVLPSTYSLWMKESMFNPSSAKTDVRTEVAPVTGSVVMLAIATTFGSTTSGTAMFAKGGTDSVNAAMSWMRKSPICVVSSMVLALLGPLTFPLVHVGLAASLISATKKKSENDQKIKEVNRLIEEVKSKIDWIRSVRDNIKSMISVTSLLMESIDNSHLPQLPVCFDNVDYPKARLLAMVDYAKTLGKLTREPISIEN